MLRLGDTKGSRRQGRFSEVELSFIRIIKMSLLATLKQNTYLNTVSNQQLESQQKLKYKQKWIIISNDSTLSRNVTEYNQNLQLWDDMCIKYPVTSVLEVWTTMYQWLQLTLNVFHLMPFPFSILKMKHFFHGTLRYLR